MNKDNNYNSGIGFCGMLGILFIGLKLTNYINWSWWLVLLPLYWWLPVLCLVVIVAVLISAFKKL